MVQVVVKKKKKVWFTILSPKDFGGSPIAETLASETSSLPGRVLKLNLMDLTGDMKKQNVQLTFKITEVKEGEALTSLIRYELMPSYVRRMMRKERAKVEDSFIAQSKDGVKLRVKPFIIVKNKTQRSVLTAIRSKARAIISDSLKEQGFADFINDSISTKAQKSLREQLKKVYPIAMLEFKIIERV